jgi:hypothetical protein
MQTLAHIQAELVRLQGPPVEEDEWDAVLEDRYIYFDDYPGRDDAWTHCTFGLDCCALATTLYFPPEAEASVLAMLRTFQPGVAPEAVLAAVQPWAAAPSEREPSEG